MKAEEEEEDEEERKKRRRKKRRRRDSGPLCHSLRPLDNPGRPQWKGSPVSRYSDPSTVSLPQLF